MQLSSKMMSHHSVMTSSLHIKNLKLDKFDDFSSYIDFNSKSKVFRDVIYLIINQSGLGIRTTPLAGSVRQTRMLLNNTI